MSYYSGVIEHDTGIHADAEQTVAGRQMLMVSITVAEYRSLIMEKGKNDFEQKAKDEEIVSCKQKLYDALKAMDECIPMNESQKAEYRKLCGDWQIRK